MPLHSLPDFQYLCLLIPHHLVWQHRHSLPHQLHHKASIFQESICSKLCVFPAKMQARSVHIKPVKLVVIKDIPALRRRCAARCQMFGLLLLYMLSICFQCRQLFSSIEFCARSAFFPVTAVLSLYSKEVRIDGRTAESNSACRP
ncbi:hypothetical protein KCU98_g249, partial [Aureobasidium melanogenum]